VALSLIAFLTKPSPADTISYEYLEVLTSMGPLQMGQSADWIASDTCISATNREIKSIDEIECTLSFFNHVDYNLTLSALNLFWTSPRYFVTVASEENTNFRVLYYDAYNNMPSTGYPKVNFWDIARSSATTLTLDFIGSSAGGYLYEKSIALPVGDYRYEYLVKNDIYPEEYKLEVSSFVVSERPAPFTNVGIEDCTVVSNAKIVLRWFISDPGGSPLYHELYVRKTPDVMSLVYQGYDSSYELNTLDYGTQYYWQVKSSNVFGISRKSPVYKFTTINTIEKPFNYPNPFNPRKGKTNIVFKVDVPQTVNIKIFSEYGDLAFQTDFNALAGVNEFPYDGKDGHGNYLYNGSYISRIETSEGNRTFYILVIQ